MKNKVFIILVILVLLTFNPFKVSAQTTGATPTPTATIAPTPAPIGTVTVVDNKATVSFAQMGFRDDTLISPFDSTRVLFSIPPNWQLVPGGEVQINYDITFTGADISKLANGVNPYGGSMTVLFNQKVIGSIPVDKVGSNSVTLEIPPVALVAAREDGRHQLTISLDAQFTCTYDIRAAVVIKSTSVFNLPFKISPPELSLAKLPAPFFLENALIPDRTIIVTADNASAGELQAGLNIMAGFGSLIGLDADFEMINNGALTQQDLANSNLIFVGKPNEMDRLSEVKFPLAVTGGQFANLPTVAANDGVLELAASPWNENKAVMLVSGASDEAVGKAAHAVSSGKIFLFDNPVLSYVSNVQLQADNFPVVEDFSFQDLGYPTQTLSGIGLFGAEFDFSIAKEQIAARDGYVDLAFYHSGLVDYGASSFSVSLNGQLINGTPFSTENEKLTTVRINIPAGLLRFGLNRLSISARMIATISCDTSGFSNPWLIISNESRIHIPVTTVDNSLNKFVLDLKSFPNLFLTRSDLGDVAFVFPKSNPDSLKIAGNLAYSFGKTATSLLPNLTAAYADDVSTDVRNNKSLIVIGKANTVPFLNEINSTLPAPFDFKDNTASEGNMQITYRVPDGVSVGYLELIKSPFNNEKAILVVSGNNDAGLKIASDTLSLSTLTSQLAGLFAVSNGTKVATGAITGNFSVVGQVIPDAQPVINQPVLPATTTETKIPVPGWLIPLIIVSLIIMVLVLGYVISRAMMKRRWQKIDVNTENIDESD